MAANQEAINVEFKKQFDRMLVAIRELAKQLDTLDGRVKDVEKAGAKDYSKEIAAMAKRLDALEKKK